MKYENEYPIREDGEERENEHAAAIAYKKHLYLPWNMHAGFASL